MQGFLLASGFWAVDLEPSKPDLLIGVFRKGASMPNSHLEGVEEFAPDFQMDTDLLGTGSRQHYFLGKLFKEKYTELNSRTFEYQLLNVTSSGCSAALTSSSCFLTGFYEDVLPYKVETFGEKSHLKPPWDSALSDFDYQEVLPFDLTLKHSSSSFSQNDFLFNSDAFCKNLQKEILQTQDDKEDELKKRFTELIFLLNDIKWLKPLLEKADLKRLGEISEYLRFRVYRDPRNIPPEITYQVQAHLIFLDALLTYSQLDSDSVLDNFLTPLAEEWIDFIESKLQDSPDNQLAYKSPVQLYFGNAKNVSALILKFFNPNFYNEILEKYKQDKNHDIINVTTEDELKGYVNYLEEDVPALNIDYASNLIFEIEKSGSDKIGKRSTP